LTNSFIKNLPQDKQQVCKKKCHQGKGDFFMAGVGQKDMARKLLILKMRVHDAELSNAIPAC